MGFWTYVSLVLGIAAAATVLAVIKQRPGSKQMLDNALAQIDGFHASETIMACDCSAAIATDERNRRLCLLRIAGERTECRVLDYRDLVSCEVLEDEAIVASAARGSAGSVCVRSDTLPARAVALKSVRSIALRLEVRDADSPMHELSFFRGELRRDSGLHREHSARVLHWHEVMAGIVRLADEAREPQAQAPQALPARVYVADELYKLLQLRDSGILSNAQFEQQKSRLLG